MGRTGYLFSCFFPCSPSNTVGALFKNLVCGFSIAILAMKRTRWRCGCVLPYEVFSLGSFRLIFDSYVLIVIILPFGSFAMMINVNPSSLWDLFKVWEWNFPHLSELLYENNFWSYNYSQISIGKNCIKLVYLWFFEDFFYNINKFCYFMCFGLIYLNLS